MHKFCLLIKSNSSVDILFQEKLRDGQNINDIAYLWEELPHNSHMSKKHTEDNVFTYIFGDSQNINLPAVHSGLTERLNIPYGQYIALSFSLEHSLLYLAADPSGIRSIFWMKAGENIVITSSIGYAKSRIDWETFSSDPVSEEFCLRYGYLPTGNTVYAGMKEIMPNQCCAIALTDGTVTETWSNSYHWEEQKSNNDPFETQLYHLLYKIIEEQAGSHNEVGVLLGGFDSALVVAFLARMGKKVQTYSFRYPEQDYNQPFVDELASIPGVSTNWIDIEADILESLIIRYSTISNYPTLWLGYVLQTAYLCEEMAKQGILTCLSGDGCDTAFMGYPSTHHRGSIYKKFPRLPKSFTKIMIGAGNFIKLEYIFGHVYRVLKSLLTAATYPTEERPIRSFQIFDDKATYMLTGKKPEYETKIQGLLKAYDTSLGQHSFDRKMYHAKSLFSPNRNKLSSSSDLSGVIIQSPYIHPELKAFVSQLPDNILRSSTGADEGKELLMKMAESHSLLPTHIIHQKKLAAISSPIDEWFAGPIKPCCINIINNSHLCPNTSYVDSIFRDLFIEKVYKNHFSNDRVVSIAASLLSTYASFFQNEK